MITKFQVSWSLVLCWWINSGWRWSRWIFGGSHWISCWSIRWNILTLVFLTRTPLWTTFLNRGYWVMLHSCNSCNSFLFTFGFYSTHFAWTWLFGFFELNNTIVFTNSIAITLVNAPSPFTTVFVHTSIPMIIFIFSIRANANWIRAIDTALNAIDVAGTIWV